MKKLLILAVLAFGMNATAQESYLSGLVDLKNATFGSTPTNNKPAFDGMFKCTMVGESGFKIDVKYETFSKIGFQRFGVGTGWVYEWDFYLFGKDLNLTIAPTVGVSAITRNWDYYYEDFVINPEISIPLRYRLNDKWGIELHPELLFRGDLHERYGKGGVYTKDDVKPSIHGGITYKISN